MHPSGPGGAFRTVLGAWRRLALRPRARRRRGAVLPDAPSRTRRGKRVGGVTHRVRRAGGSLVCTHSVDGGLRSPGARDVAHAASSSARLPAAIAPAAACIALDTNHLPLVASGSADPITDLEPVQRVAERAHLQRPPSTLAPRPHWLHRDALPMLGVGWACPSRRLLPPPRRGAGQGDRAQRGPERQRGLALTRTQSAVVHHAPDPRPGCLPLVSLGRAWLGREVGARPAGPGSSGPPSVPHAFAPPDSRVARRRPSHSRTVRTLVQVRTLDRG